MTNNVKMLLGALAGAAVLVGVVVLASRTEPAAPVATTGPAAQPAPEEATSSELPPPPRPRMMVELLTLTTPEKTVETQVRALLGDREATFRNTFLPSVEPQIDAAAWEACKRRVKAQPVSADWSNVVEGKTDGGATVRRVTLLGGVQVGFHLFGQHWLADTVWCRDVVK